MDAIPWFVDISINRAIVVFGTPLLMSLLAVIILGSLMVRWQRVTVLVAYLIWSYCWMSHWSHDFVRAREVTLEERLTVYTVIGW